MGSRHPMRRSSTGWRAGRRHRRSRWCRCSVRSCWRIRWRTRTGRRSILPPWRWSGSGMAFACRSRAVAARCGSSRAAATTSPRAFLIWSRHWRFDAVLDGELLVMRDGAVAPFSDLQQRLNRKTVTRAMMTKYPVHVRLYDALELGGEDLRHLSLAERRRRLEDWHRQMQPRGTDLSELVQPDSQGGAAPHLGRHAQRRTSRGSC